jgi:long-chain acyl-CoA synthetase
MESNLARLAETALERNGDYPSLHYGNAWFSSYALHDRAARVGEGLRLAGVRPGHRVIVIMANCPEVHVAYQALWRIGAAITPVVFLVTPAELRHIIADSGAVAVITTEELVPKVDLAQRGLPREIAVFAVGDTFEQLETAAPGSIVDRDPDALAALLYTGGTTGRSKGVPLSHRNLAEAGFASRGTSHIPGQNVGIIALPLSHSFGLLVTVGAMHAPEPPVAILQRWFQPAEWLRLASAHCAQATAVVPSMLAILLSQPLEEYDLSRLRYVYSGAAPLSVAVVEEFSRRVPSATILEGYGCTETSAVITSMPAAAPRLGTVGVAAPGVSIRIVGSDGTDRAPGEDGEIWVSGPTVMSGYWRGEQLSDGWFATGDVGRLDEDGYLTIVDRIKDLILRGGFNVYPRDVEDALMTHPSVAMAAAVGRPDARLGEEVVAFVSLAEGATIEGSELIAYAKEHLGAHKYPREVHIVDVIPLTSVGKLDRKRLRAAVQTDGPQR